MTKSEKSLILDRIESASFHYNMSLYQNGSEKRREYCAARLKTIVQLATDLGFPMDEITAKTINGEKSADALHASA